MSPNKASLYFAEYRRGTLDAGTAAKVRHLLESDPKVRADFETDSRLSDLIGLKRYEAQKLEQAGQFDTFLAEFHRRQRTELVMPEPFWKTIPSRIQETIQDYFVTPTSAFVRYSGVAALLAVVVGLSLFSSSNPGTSRAAQELAPLADSSIANVPVVFANNMSETPVHHILQRVNTSTGEHGRTRLDF
jgi:hypothetical protein